MVISKSTGSAGENLHTEISNRNAVIHSYAPKDNTGGGDYLRPSELLCASLAACMNMTVRAGLDARNVEYDQIIVKVDLDRSDKTTSRFIYDVDVTGATEETKQLAQKLATACKIKKTLSKDIVFDQAAL